MGVLSRSWEITKLTFSVMKKEKELFIFPVLSVIFSIAFFVAILFPTIILELISQQTITWEIIDYIWIFLTYLVLAFIATFFNVCVVYTAARAFGNQEARFGKTIKFALSKIHIIFFWSLLSATVGLIFKIIEGVAQKTKGVGKSIIIITSSLFKMAWGISTIFVIPGLVYHSLSPFAAIKKSVEVLRKTWGESLIRYLSVNLISFVFIFVGTILGVPIIITGFFVSFVVGILAAVVFIIYILSVILVFSVANQIFNTALYIYAESGAVPSPYSNELLRNAFKIRK